MIHLKETSVTSTWYISCEIAGNIKCDRDEAIIMMGETNFRIREKILPSEKAWTYRGMVEAMNRQGKRLDLTSDPVGQKLTSRQEIAKNMGEGEMTIQLIMYYENYIRSYKRNNIS